MWISVIVIDTLKTFNFALQLPETFAVSPRLYFFACKLPGAAARRRRKASYLEATRDTGVKASTYPGAHFLGYFAQFLPRMATRKFSRVRLVFLEMIFTRTFRSAFGFITAWTRRPEADNLNLPLRYRLCSLGSTEYSQNILVLCKPCWCVFLIAWRKDE